MALVNVVFNGTRLNSSDSNIGWGNYGSGGGAPASEGANAYQISTGAGANTGAVGKKVNSTTARVGVDYNGSNVNYTLAANRLWFAKAYVADAFDLDDTFGAELGIGSGDQGPAHIYNVAGTGSALSVYNTWIPQGGYLITCIDPTIDTWASIANSGGTTDQTAISWYGFRCQFKNGNAKSENVALDAIDYGTGLTLTQGDTGTKGQWVDFYKFDQDIVNNRWGAAIGKGDSVICRGIMSVGGGGTLTHFDDVKSIVTFPDGYHSRGLFGVVINLDNASNVINEGALIIGEGSRNGVDANDTRPDYTVVGVLASSSNFSHTLRNFRDITYTSICELDEGDIECQLLVQNSAHIQNSKIRTNSLTSVACLQDPTFGTTTGIHDTTFIQTGAGHAFELDTATSYTLTNIEYSGYGSNGTDNAAIDITAPSGTVTININGGDTPSYKTAGATVVINNSRVLTITDLPNESRVILVDTGLSETDPSFVLKSENVVSGTFTYSFNAGSNINALYRVINLENRVIEKDVLLNNLDVNISFILIDDTKNYKNE